MKKLSYIMVICLVVNCTSTQLIDRWKNPDINTYEPYKILVVGLTSNDIARQQFEQQLKKEFELRGSEAVMSLDVLDTTPKTDKMTETELDSLENQLIEDGFDTILLTKIIGVEDKISYHKDYKSYERTYRKFKDEYLMYQDIFYNPDYYNEYKVYTAETSMYCICPTKARELLWKGYINITDPISIEKTVNDYVKLTIVALEQEQLVKTKIITQEDTSEEISNY